MARMPSAVLGVAELVAHDRKALVVGRCGTDRAVDHRHDLVDLVHHPVADLVELVGEACRREIGRVDALEIGIGQVAVLLQRFVDRLIQRRIVAGRVGVPDLIVARDRRLTQSLDLAQCNLGECKRAFVLRSTFGPLVFPAPRATAAGLPRFAIAVRAV